jgi:hypothetical protein
MVSTFITRSSTAIPQQNTSYGGDCEGFAGMTGGFPNEFKQCMHQAVAAAAYDVQTTSISPVFNCFGSNKGTSRHDHTGSV